MLNGILRVGVQRKKGIVTIYNFLCYKDVVNTFGFKSTSTFLIIFKIIPTSRVQCELSETFSKCLIVNIVKLTLGYKSD